LYPTIFVFCRPFVTVAKICGTVSPALNVSFWKLRGGGLIENATGPLPSPFSP
jgi:hypothetical protein